MSKQDFISSSLSGGLHTDSHISTTPKNSYTYALNLINRDLDQSTFPSNEHSNKPCGHLPDEVVGAGYIDERDSTLFFLRDGSIYLISHNTCETTFVSSDTEFGCDWGFGSCEWVKPEFKVMQPCSELFVYWSSGCEYYWINLEEHLSEKRKSSLKEAISSFSDIRECPGISCDYFKVFRSACSPTLSPFSANGGQLRAGAYQFAIRYKNTEGGYTNWFNVSDPVYIGSDHNQAGEISTSSIEVNLTGLDCSYDSVELAVVETIGGITQAKSIGILNFSGHTLNYTYFGNEGTPIEVSELLIKYKTRPQGQDLFQDQGVMMYYNIRQDRNLDWQREVNNIKLEVVVMEVTLEEAKKHNLKSFMGGESYAFGIAFNYDDQTHSPVFHIPCSGSTPAGSQDTTDALSAPPAGQSTISNPGKYERTRSPKEDSVGDPQFTEYDEILETQIGSLTTEASDVCETIATCDPCDPAVTQCSENLPQVDTILNDWTDVLSSYTSDDLTIDFSPGSIQESATNLINAVKNKENIEIEGKEYQTNKDVAYSSSSQGNLQSGEPISPTEIIYGSMLYDANGKPLTEISPRIIDIISTECKEEEDILYPETKNCEGEYIYGDLAATNVKHHKFPDRSKHPHFISNSVGVPSLATPDADEYSDGYVRLYGIRVSNISLPTKDDSGKDLCRSNPYTILMVDRNKTNRTVVYKGLATGTYTSSNQGKQYVYPKHGLNSFEKVNRFIDLGGMRMDPFAPNHDSVNIYSLDQLVYAPALVATTLRVERLLRGIGFRHHLYATGRAPEDSYYGSRIDQRGTVQAINLSQSFSEFQESPISFKIYSPSDHVTAPPLGGSIPLMNRFGQECAWIGANIRKVTDRSFVGDVLDHSAPIDLAEAQYVSLIRNLPNQYGDLTSLSYVPILQASKIHSVKQGNSTITGICGDIYIGPYSFVKTSYVSNKVGNKFPISNMVPGKEDRSINDPPDDTIHAMAGTWTPTTLPEELDAADAKNWAGTHTVDVSRRWLEASTMGVTESDYYYPRVLKTLITYWGEFEANPYLRMRGDTLETQYYNNIRSPFYLDSHAPEEHPWEESYLNQFYVEVEHPSKWTLIKKSLIRTILSVIAPLVGIPLAIDFNNPADFVKDLWVLPLIIGAWYLLNKVLYTENYLNKMLGIHEPKTDDEGGDDDSDVRNFFTNYGHYNNDYSKRNNLAFNYFGLPDPYYTCDCADCKTLTNQIYISDEQIPTSEIDAYKTVRPNNIATITSNHGQISNLFTIGSGLYAHTTDNILMLRYNQTTIPSSSGELQMGMARLLDHAISIANNVPEGQLGLKYANAAIQTQYGYFFVDSEAGKIYQFSRDGLQEISYVGMYHFFKKYIPFCNSSDCVGEHGDSDYSLGIDPRLNRLLLTKRDQCGSWTISYDLERKHWVSFHSYIPNTYIWDRYNMYTINNSTSEKFWVHNDECRYQTYYNQPHPFIVELPIVDTGPFQYLSSIVDTEARVCTGSDYLYNRDVTFNELELWNSWQTTGTLTLVPELHCGGENAVTKSQDQTDHITLKRSNNSWRFNAIMDYTADHNHPILTRSCVCHPYQSLINIDHCKHINNQDYKNRIVFDNYIVTRLIFNNFTDVKLYTKNIAHYIDRKVR